MDLGIDIGTSEVKVVLVDEMQRMAGHAGAPVHISRPLPLWSEQDPEDWWRPTRAALHTLRGQHPKGYAAVQGIGLSGHTQGAPRAGQPQHHRQHRDAGLHGTQADLGWGSTNPRFLAGLRACSRRRTSYA